MSSSERDGFLQVLKDVTVPDGYASNISRRVNMKERKISGLKSHDNHILMQQLFPIALRGSLPSHVTRPLIKLACFFREICSKTLSVSDIATVEADIAVTLCELEKIFPPSFFTVMVHLVMHLAAEAKIGGPVHYRWMYPIERYLGRLKSYVRNRAAPEGSIAEGYIVEECLTFCSRYMEGVETIFNRPIRTIEESTGVVSIVTLSNKEWTQAHRYVLFNSENINHFHEMHKRLMEDELRKGHHRISEAIIYKHHMEKFCSWFRCHVMSLTTADREREGVSDTLAALSKWPYNYVKRLKHYVINGLKFRSVKDELLNAGIGRKRPLKFVHVGEGSSRLTQRREEELEAGCTAEQARADASVDETQPPAMRRGRGLTVVEVGEGNGRSRQSVQEELDAAFVADQARGDASDDDETQPPDDVVQETPASNNLRKKRGNTLLTRIWSLPPNMKIECELNARGQPIGESGKTFKRWLGTFCLSHVYCPLVPTAWTRVPTSHKVDSWTEIEKRWIIDPEIIQPADQMTWAMHQLGELRRNRRGKLKRKCYKDDALRADVIQSRPDWADEQEFIQLVDYWFHEDTRTLSSTNKRSRGKQKEIARSGPISFAQTADDMAKETGQAVERAVLFAKVYSTKEGHPVTPDVGEKIKQMTEILPRGSSLQGSRREGILWSKDDAFAQVMGAERSGRVRGVGFGPTPSGRNGSNRSCYTLPSSSIVTAHRMTELETSHQTLRDQLAQVEQRHQEQIAELHEQHKAELTSAIAQSEARHNEKMAEVMKVMGEMVRDLRSDITASQLQSQGNTASN